MAERDVRVVLHGHFYQPPRESPWTDEVPEQEGARPYHDWNERIWDECYRPNTASRVLDTVGRIRAIVNNFEWMSFNVGPTLMTWLERTHPQVVTRMQAADAASVGRLGHGNAIAQAYHHLILPLASRRDRRTQIVWGLREFAHRFGRDAAGMWLPETAIDAETVEDLIAAGVRFTILSPYQAKRVRPLPGGDWRGVAGGGIDPKVPYRIRSRRQADAHLDVFFYDGPIARGVAFDGLLRSSAGLADRLAAAADASRGGLQAVSVAVDGETFGHHWPFGDMCLASFFLDEAAKRNMRIANYAAVLAQQPPALEVELEAGPAGEGTAWSCAHGVGRWVRDCGCSTGAEPGWNQAWRTPLRTGLDHLRNAATTIFETRGADVLHDPWAARDDYVAVVNRFGGEASALAAARDAFLDQHLRPAAAPAHRVQALELLEAQRHAMAMYTSCGWFFADPSGIETQQNLSYAARCLQLLRPWTGHDLERVLLADLGKMHGNRGEDGAALYRRLIAPEVRTPALAANARAMFRLLRASRGTTRIYGFDVREEAPEELRIGGHAAVTGRMSLRDRWTERQNHVSYVAVEYAPRHLHTFVQDADAVRHQALLEAIHARADALAPAELEVWLQSLCGNPPLGVEHLLPAQRRRIAERLAQERVEGLRHHYRAVYEDSVHLLQDYASLQLELPLELRAPCEFVLQADLAKAARLLTYPYDAEAIHRLRRVFDTAARYRLRLDPAPAADALGRALADALHRVLDRSEARALDAIDRLLDAVEALQLDIDRTEAEELVYSFLRRAFGGPDAAPDGIVNRCLALAPRFNLAPEVLPEPLRRLNAGV
jgi:alpha-amylase/alpha-mannosidase (GH57 family)